LARLAPGCGSHGISPTLFGSNYGLRLALPRYWQSSPSTRCRC